MKNVSFVHRYVCEYILFILSCVKQIYIKIPTVQFTLNHDKVDNLIVIDNHPSINHIYTIQRICMFFCILFLLIHLSKVMNINELMDNVLKFIFI